MPSRILDLPFDALSRISADAFSLVAAGGEVLEWGEAAASVTGIPANVAIGAQFSSLFVNSVALLQQGSGPEPIQIGLSNEKPVRWLRAAAVPIGTGFLVSFGPQRRFDQIEQLKNEILASISHELKTPIATIKAFATTLRQNPSVEGLPRDEYFRTIEEQVDRLARAVDGLLRAARVDADQLLARRERVELDTLLDDVLGYLSAIFPNRTVDRKGGSTAICGDPDLLREMLLQLIENAMKFSLGDSPIEVSGLMFGETSVISIRDRGMGIDKEHLPYIFERFYRAEQTMTASTGGTGLGLHIVRSLVRAHAGKISVESTVGMGTVVTIMLPNRL